MVWYFVAVAVGAYLGILWPVIIKAFRDNSPPTRVHERSTRLWLGLGAVIAVVVTALNFAPLVTGDTKMKLDDLGPLAYFFLLGEGFGLAALISEPLKKP